MSRFIVRLRPEVDRDAFIQEMAARGAEVVYVFVGRTDRFAARLPPALLAALRGDRRVVAVTADTSGGTLGSIPVAEPTVTDPALTSNWNLDRINQRFTPLDHRYTYGRDGSGVDVYVIDTGIRYDHEEFGGRAKMLPGFDPFGDGGTDTAPSGGHGTGVASIIAGRSYGVARRARLYSVKVFDPVYNVTWASVFSDGCYAVLNHHLSKTDSRPSVVNLSLEFSLLETTGDGELVNEAVRDLIAAGVVVVIAAGNDSRLVAQPAVAGSTPALRSCPQSVELDFYARFRVAADPGATEVAVWVPNPDAAAAGPTPYVSQSLTGGAVPTTATPRTAAQRLVDAIRGRSLVHGFTAKDNRHDPLLPDGDFTIEKTLASPLPEECREVRVTATAGSIHTLVDFRDIKAVVTAATTDGDMWAGFSNYGPLVDLLAPGHDVPLAARLGTATQGRGRGTSFAAPHVAGVAALHLTGKSRYRPLPPYGDSVVAANSPATVHAFLVDNATQGVIRNVPTGTPNRLLYSYYIAGEVAWVTDADLGIVPERVQVSLPLAVEVRDETARPVSGPPVTYSVVDSSLPGWLRLDPATGLLFGMTPEVEDTLVDPRSPTGPRGQEFRFRLKAASGAGETEVREFHLIVRNVNRPPVWQEPLYAETTIEVVEKTAFPVFRFAVLEPDGQPVTFAKGNPATWPDWLTLTVEGRDAAYSNPDNPREVRHTATVAGTAPDLGPGRDPRLFEALLLATDGTATITRTLKLRVLQEPNRPPLWETPAGPLPGVREGDPFDVQFLVTDADADPLTFRTTDPETPVPGTTPGLPPGLVLDTATGRLSGTAGEVALTTTFAFDVVVSDGDFEVSRSFTIEVTNITDALPTWITPEGSIGTVLSGETTILSVHAEPPLDAEVIYRVVAGRLPAGLTLAERATTTIDPDSDDYRVAGMISGIATPVTETETTEFTIEAIAVIGGVEQGGRRRRFSITVLGQADQDVVVWVTPAGDIGSVPEETPSLLAVRARLPNASTEPIHYGIGSRTVLPDPKAGGSKTFLVTDATQQEFALDTTPPDPAKVRVYRRTGLFDEASDTEIIDYTWSGPRNVRLATAVPRGTAIIVHSVPPNDPRDFLPAGMDLAESDGDALLVGRPRLLDAHQSVDIIMKAWTGPIYRPRGTSAPRAFSFRVENAYPGEFANVYLTLSGKDRRDWQSWQLNPLNSTPVTPLIADGRIFRLTDRFFGRCLDPRSYLISGLALPLTAAEKAGTAPRPDSAVLLDRLAHHIGQHHQPVKVMLGRIRLGVARDPDSNAVLYEFLYVPLIDFGATQDHRTSWPFPASINNIRRDLADDPGFVRTTDPAEILPLWMRSQQIQNGVVEYGFKPVLPLAYIKPGLGASVLARLQQMGLDRTMDGRTLVFDRYVIEVVRAGGPTQAATKYLKFPPGDR